MPTFRLHLAGGAKVDIDAETPAEARRKAADRKLGPITRIKRLKEQSEFQTKLDIAGRA